MTLAAVFTIAIITGLAGLAIGAPKGHPVWGFFLGFLLSVIGLAVIICTRPSHRSQVRQATARLAAEDEARKARPGVTP
jgi:hypothetical protein